MRKGGVMRLSAPRRRFDHGFCFPRRAGGKVRRYSKEVMWRFGGPGVFSLAAVAAALSTTVRARAEEPTPLRIQPGLPAHLSLPPLYPSERLRLAWPIKPLRFAFTEVMPIGLGFARGPTEYFVAESVWVEAGPFSVRTRLEAGEAIELDCKSYTCAPVRELAMTTEARLSLGALGRSSVVPDNWLFARYKHYAGTGAGFVQPGKGQVQLGWGGLLDL